MLPESTPAMRQQRSASVEPTWFDSLIRQIVRKRVAISVLIFAAVLTRDFLIGLRPRNWTNFTDAVANLALLSLLTGLVIRSWAAGTLKKSTSLATTGPYRLVRHPLYLGSFLMMGGICLLLGGVFNVLGVLGSMAPLYGLAIRSEERSLAKHFRDVWQQFARSTPAIIPRSISLDSSGWTVTQWRKNREYQAILGTLAGLAALKWWQVH